VSERAVAVAFVVSILAALGLTAVYAAGGDPQVEGALLLLALGGLGVGLLGWAGGLLAHLGEHTEPRRRHPAADGDGDVAVATFEAGVAEVGRRRLLARLLAGAVAALGLAAVFPIRSLGSAPGSQLARTSWRRGVRLVTADGTPVQLGALELNTFTTVFPEDDVGSADAQAVLIRVDPTSLQLPPDRLAAAPQGHVAYSKLCTHAGCPLGLYLAATQELRCPCHQSTFDVLRGARPVYGPAPKPLPQLPLEVGPDGTLRAAGDFTEPVGPSWWDLPR
jgi:ubiquinol-cytochrome c reductase iron-sulfur subunit